MRPGTDATRRPRRYREWVQQVPWSVRAGAQLRRVRNINPWVLDAIIATVLLPIALANLFQPRDGSHIYRDADAMAVVLTVAGVIPYYFRRHAPMAVLFAASTPLILMVARDYNSNGLANGVYIIMFTVGRYCEQRSRTIAVAWLAIALLICRVVGPSFTDTNLVVNFLAYTAAYFFGSTIRNRRLYTHELEERAASSEREREEEAKRAVADERLRIAQELHDVVAHSMGVIAVQAGVGAHVIDNDPAEAKRSLENIAATSRASLTEIRRILGVLRGDERAAYAPAPGMQDLERLARDIDAAGVPVEVEVTGAQVELPHGVDLTAYRIVQEALTNVLKHAGPSAHANVRVTYEPGALALEITDDGRGVNGHSTEGGHGLVGMRERVGVYGGTLETGSRAGGGYRVAARLPYAAPGEA